MCLVCLYVFVFFFKQKTAYEMRISDWSSDVCSSDLTRSPSTNPAAMAERISGGRDGPFPASATALLLVDMQRIWLEPGRNPGHPDWAEDHPFHRHVAGHTIPNQRRLLDAARGAGVEVIHTILRSLTRDGRDRPLDHKLNPLERKSVREGKEWTVRVDTGG